MPRIALSVGPWRSSSPVQLITQLSDATLKLSLARGPEVTFSMPSNSPAARVSSGLATDVWVMRYGVPIERCRMLPIDQLWGADGTSAARVLAVGYKRLVEARYIVSGPPVFNGVDQGEIMWQLIVHTQAQSGGNMGITAGARTTGVVRDRNEYRIGDNLGKLMTDLGNVIDGAWWGVDADRVFTARLWDDFETHTDPVVLGRNAVSMDRARGKAFANAAGAMGSVEQTVPTWVASADVTTDLRGRWEAFDASHSTVTEQPTVDNYAAGLLAERERQPGVWRVELEPAWWFDKGSDYMPGDYVHVVVPASAVDELGPAPVEALGQVTEVSIAFGADDATAVALAIEEVN